MKKCNLCEKLTDNFNICDDCYKDLEHELKILNIAPSHHGCDLLEERIRKAKGIK